MFAYSPTPDRSGEILGTGQMQAAATNQRAMENLGDDIGGAIASFADAYVQGQERKAKAKGYADFLGMHGDTLGLNPEWLEEFKKKPVNEQIAMGDMMLNSYLPHKQRMEYLNTQAESFGGRGKGGGGGGGDYVVGQGWQ